MSNTSDQTTKPSKTTRLIVGEVGVDTETGIVGKGHSYDNGKTFVVDDTIYGRIYHTDDHDKIWKGIQDQVAKVVDPAKSAADSAVNAADAAVASAQVTSATVSAVASATAEAKQGANEAMSRALSAWDVATGVKSAVTDFDPLLKSAQSDAGMALTQIADTANALSDAKTAFGSDVATAKELASTAQTTADSAVAVASDAHSNATVAIQTASGASLTAIDAKSDATIAKQTASEAIVQASNADSDFAQLSIRANKIEANVANNSGAIASVQQTANGLTTTVADIKANGGGVNLANGTKSDDQTFGDASQTTGWQITTIATFDNPQAGQQYTVSVNTKTNGGSWRIQIWDGTSPTQRGKEVYGDPPVVAQEQKHTATITWPSGSNKYLLVQLVNNNDGGQIIWNSAMLEEGTVAHAWSPSTDDLQSRFTQIKQSMDGINTTINDPKTGLNATYQTAAGNSNTISNVKGDVTQLQSTANGLTSRVGNLESKTDKQQTAIEQNKTDITLKADQTTVNTLKGTVDQNTATLKTQAGQIQAKVSASDVTGMLSGYATQSYAQSLVTQTADKWNLNLTSLQTNVNVIKTTGGGVNLANGTKSDDQTFGDASQTTGWQITTIATFDNPQAGQQYTVSVNTKTNGGSWRIQIWDGTSPTQRGKEVYGDPPVVAQEQKHTATITWPSGSNKYLLVQLVNNNDGGQIIWNSAMLEEGTVAHTWAPAPSDLATVTSVANLSATVDGIQSQVYNSDGSSRITQLSNLIQSKVGTDDFNNLKKAVDLQTLDSADINNMKTSGHYFVHNLANNPIGGWVYVDVTGDGNIRIRQDVYQDIGTQHKYRRWIDNRWTDWEEGATYSEINQLKDAINLRVTKGDLISQINLQAGASLIQSDKLVLDANTTVITGNAFIPSAAISNLTADQVQAGTLSGSKVHAGDNSGNGIDMGVLSDNYVGLKAYANNGDHTDIDLNGIHNYGASYNTRIQQGKITTNYLAVNGGGMIDFRDSNGTGMIAEGSTLKFDVRNISAGYLSCGGAPLADWPSGSVGNELKIMYGGSLAIAASSDTNSRALFSTVDTQIGYQQAGSTSPDVNLTGLRVNNSDRYVRLGTWNSNSTWSQAEFSSDGVNINYAGLSLGLNTNVIHMYMNGNYSATAMQIKVDGWAWINGYCEAMGHTQHSTLSTKTRIEEADPDHMLDLVNNTELTTFDYKSELADGANHRHIGPIIDDVNDVAQYRIPAEFIAPTKTARDDDNMIGALFGAVQALTKRIKKLEEKA